MVNKKFTQIKVQPSKQGSISIRKLKEENNTNTNENVNDNTNTVSDGIQNDHSDFVESKSRTYHTKDFQNLCEKFGYYKS